MSNEWLCRKIDARDGLIQPKMLMRMRKKCWPESERVQTFIPPRRLLSGPRSRSSCLLLAVRRSLHCSLWLAGLSDFGTTRQVLFFLAASRPFSCRSQWRRRTSAPYPLGKSRQESVDILLMLALILALKSILAPCNTLITVGNRTQPSTETISAISSTVRPTRPSHSKPLDASVSRCFSSRGAFLWLPMLHSLAFLSAGRCRFHFWRRLPVWWGMQGLRLVQSRPLGSRPIR